MNEIKEKLMELLLELSDWSADKLIVFQAEWLKDLRKRDMPSWLIQWCDTAMQILIESQQARA